MSGSCPEWSEYSVHRQHKTDREQSRVDQHLTGRISLSVGKEQHAQQRVRGEEYGYCCEECGGCEAVRLGGGEEERELGQVETDAEEGRVCWEHLNRMQPKQERQNYGS